MVLAALLLTGNWSLVNTTWDTVFLAAVLFDFLEFRGQNLSAFHFFFPVSGSSGCFRDWMCKIVQRNQKEEDLREHRISMWGHTWMDPNSACLLCIVWYIGRYCWGTAWIWWWIHFGSSPPWDWCHASGMIIHTLVHLILHFSCLVPKKTEEIWVC